MYNCILFVLLNCSMLSYNPATTMQQRTSDRNQINDLIKNLEDAGKSMQVLQVSGPGELREVFSQMDAVKKLSEVNQDDLSVVIKELLEKDQPPKNADATYSAL